METSNVNYERARKETKDLYDSFQRLIDYGNKQEVAFTMLIEPLLFKYEQVIAHLKKED